MEQSFVDLIAKAGSQEAGVWDLSKQKDLAKKIEISLLWVTN